MLSTLLSLAVTMALLMGLMVGWIHVQRAARRVAEQHPEAGPLRLIGGGCGGHGHGSEARPTPGVPAPQPGRRVVRIATVARKVVADAGGCASCTNTACKPAMPGADGASTSCTSAG